MPIAAALVFIPAKLHPTPIFIFFAGVVLVAAGEALRLWAVRHIGVISRTRSDRLGPLVATGPFALVRNPLYIGNIALWMGFTLNAGLPILLPVVFLLLAFEYHAIVRWEERLLEQRMGETFSAYLRDVPRWVPRHASSQVPGGARGFSWRETIFSERGTLVAIALGYVVLWLKWLLVG